MSQYACIVTMASNVGLPFGLPQIIADYASWSDDERLDELFRVSNNRCSVRGQTPSTEFLELRQIDGLVKISYVIGSYTRQDFWRKCLIVSCMANGKFENILNPHKNLYLNPRIVDNLVDQLYKIWCGL